MQMGKVDHRHNKVEPFAALCRALGIVLSNTCVEIFELFMGLKT